LESRSKCAGKAIASEINIDAIGRILPAAVLLEIIPGIAVDALSLSVVGLAVGNVDCFGANVGVGVEGEAGCAGNAVKQASVEGEAVAGEGDALSTVIVIELVALVAAGGVVVRAVGNHVHADCLHQRVLRQAGNADLLRVQLRTALRKGIAIAVDEEITSHALQANASWIEYLTVGHHQVAGRQVLTQGVTLRALRTSSCRVVVHCAVNDVEYAVSATDLEALIAAEAGPVRTGSHAVGGQQSADAVGVEIVALDAGEADVGLQVVGLTVEDGDAQHAQSVVQDVVRDAGLAGAGVAG
jgi:hypothetical protein